jgi:Class III cytochrome C family/Cytochrome c7 and related cytochrome c
MSVTNGRAKFHLLCAVFILVLAATVFSQSEDAPPQKNAVAPPQPIPFSHKTHVSVGMQCDYCHQVPDPGIDVSIPASAQCMQCHVSIDTDHAAIKALSEFDKSGKPVPWSRVYTVPAWVFWNHRTHLQAGVKCESCHGEVGGMDEMKVVTDVTVMKGCVDCHEERGAPTGCAACHEDKSS